MQESLNSTSKKLVEGHEKEIEEYNTKIKSLEEKLKSEKVCELIFTGKEFQKNFEVKQKSSCLLNILLHLIFLLFYELKITG